MKRIIPLLFCFGCLAQPALAQPEPDEVTVTERESESESVLVAQADTAPAPVAAPTETAAPSEALPSSTGQPSDSIDNPLDNPVAAYDDLKAAKRIGWGAVFLVVLIMACGVASRLSTSLTWLARPRVLLAIGSIGTFAATAYNAIALGGTWVAALAAAVPPLIAVMVKVWQWEPAKTEAA